MVEVEKKKALARYVGWQRYFVGRVGWFVDPEVSFGKGRDETR